MKWHHESQAKKIPTAIEEQLLEMQSTGLELLDTRPRDQSLSLDLDLQSEATSILPTNTQPDHHQDEGEGEHESDEWNGLLRSASSSITRGTQSIVGNTIPIIEAREIVAARNNEEGRWRGMMKEWLRKYEPDEEEDMSRWICPGCKGVI